jgi:hypothetical protein
MAADTAIAMLLTVRSITQVLRRVLASCTTCLFMEIFQRTLSYCPRFRKRVQRYDYFLNRQNFLKKKFSFLASVLHFLILVNQSRILHLIIIARTLRRRDRKEWRTTIFALKVKNMQKSLVICKIVGNFAADL